MPWEGTAAADLLQGAEHRPPVCMLCRAEGQPALGMCYAACTVEPLVALEACACVAPGGCLCLHSKWVTRDEACICIQMCTVLAGHAQA